MRALRPLLFVALLAAGPLLAPHARAQEAATGSESENDRWAAGNLFFMAYHEVGHLVEDQIYHIDQNAQRLAAESRADDIGTWLLVPDSDEAAQGSELDDAIEGWLQAEDQRAGAGPWSNPHYPDDASRAARIACLLYGADNRSPNIYDDLKDIISRKFNPASCSESYRSLNKSLEPLFETARASRTAPVVKVRYTYEEAGPALKEAEDFLRKMRLLEELKDDLDESIGAPIDVTLRAAECGPGSSGFQYSPSKREITACYEEVDWFLFGDTQNGGAAAASTGDALGSRPRQQSPLQLQARPQPRK